VHRAPRECATSRRLAPSLRSFAQRALSERSATGFPDPSSPWLPASHPIGLLADRGLHALRILHVLVDDPVTVLVDAYYIRNPVAVDIDQYPVALAVARGIDRRKDLAWR